MLAEGTTFAAYQVIRRLAAGGMGEVYLCQHRVLGRLDAVKVLRRHLAADESFRRRFLREALSAARLRHPNVVSMYTAEEADGMLYLAMEYVPGQDLGSLLAEQGPLAPDRVIRLLAVVADALDRAHEAHLVHRDIKPSNLIVTGAGTAQESVTLVDFGISRMLDTDSEITRTGEIVGTIAYCSPEQLNRAPLSGACDQYALACVAYECLTGTVPFPRESQLAMMTAHLTAPPPRVTVARPELPVAVDKVLARAMAKRPADRFANCTGFVSALAAALGPLASAQGALAAGPGPAAAGDHPDFPAPAVLRSQVRGSARSLVRPPGHVDTLALRLGWRQGPSAGPLVAALLAAPLAVRGAPAAVTPCVRWLVTQVAARHQPRDVCLLAALAPADDEHWLWIGWLPHARPANPPVSGPHLATAPDTAVDLTRRLAEVVAGRRDGTLPRVPRVLALLDRRIGVSAGDPRFASAGQVGVHLIEVLAAEQEPDPGFAVFDLDGEQGRLHRVGYPAEQGSADLVDAAYVREIADLAAED
ncbi:MAG TPA: protein kinase [Micromonosporaceae bacterium]